MTIRPVRGSTTAPANPPAGCLPEAPAGELAELLEAAAGEDAAAELELVTFFGELVRFALELGLRVELAALRVATVTPDQCRRRRELRRFRNCPFALRGGVRRCFRRAIDQRPCRTFTLPV